MRTVPDNTAGGSFAICPDYHGKLRRRLTEREVLFIETCQRTDQKQGIAEGLPVANRLKGGLWDVLGTVCTKGRKIKPASAQRIIESGGIVAMDGSVAYRFEPPTPTREAE